MLSISISKEEFHERIAKTKKVIRKKNLEALIVFSPADIRYLSNYTQLAGSALVLLPLEHQPLLLIDQDWDLLRAKEVSSIPETRATADLVKEIPRIIKAFNIRENVGVVGWSIFPTPIYLAIRSSFPNVSFQDATEIVADLRMIKSQAEIQLIEKAAEITDEGVKAATEAIADGKTEVEVSKAAEIAMRVGGADTEPSFYPCVGSGHRTTLIVPLPTEKKVQNGELVLMDLGGRYKGYCGDISRTKICGTPKKEQKDLFEVVYQMNREAIEAVKPGVKAFEVHEVAKRVARESGYKDEDIKHMTGHGIGLEVHEGPILETETTELVPGIIHSIEPGLYIPGIGGIRVEDMVLVTDTGRKVLTSFNREL